MLPLGACPITIQRFAAQEMGTDGRPLAQTPTEIAALASPQPSDMTMTCTDPGYSGQQRMRFFTFTPVFAADEANGIPADRIVWNGDGVTRQGGTFLVWNVPPWQPLGPIQRHYEAEAYLLQPINPPAGAEPS